MDAAVFLGMRLETVAADNHQAKDKGPKYCDLSLSLCYAHCSARDLRPMVDPRQSSIVTGTMPGRRLSIQT